MEHTSKWIPATKKIWLHLTAGILWSGVGIMLVVFAVNWLGLVHSWLVLLLVLAGLLLATGIYFFGFSKLATSNVQRIINIPKERVCLFAFQKWTSYPLVLVMVAMGIYLRRYSPIPKPYLAILYIGLGASLFVSSLQYYIQVFRTSHM
ncbi:MAG TPA: hypothetical protein VF359_07080 [Anaerolineales bacterium]